MPPTPDLSYTGLDKFVNKPVVENYKAKSSEEEPKVVRKNDDAPTIKEWVSDNEEENVSQPKIEKKIVRHSIAKIDFVKSKQQKKTARKTVKQVEQHSQNTHYYEEINGGCVALGGNPKGGKITTKCNIKTGSGPDWLFDIDALTRLMNYKPIVMGTQSNDYADLKSSQVDRSKPLSDNGKKVDEDPRNESKSKDQEKEDNVYSLTVNAAGSSEDNELPFDLNIPGLEDVSIFNFSYDDENDGTMADMNNLDTIIQKKDGIFISQDKHVAKILKKFGFKEVKTASTPMETQKPLLKDEDSKEVDVYMYMSMIVSLMYLTSSTPDIMFIVCACARYQVNLKVSHLYAVKRICRIKNHVFHSKTKRIEIRHHFIRDCNEKKLIQMVKIHTDKNVADMLTKAFDPSDLKEQVADEVVHKELGGSLVRDATTAFSLGVGQDGGNIAKTQSKATPNESSSNGTDSGGSPRCQETMQDTTAQTRFESVSEHSNDLLLARGYTPQSDKDRLELNELMALCTNLQTRVLELEKTKTSQHNEIAIFKRSVKKLKKRIRSRTHKLKRLYKVGLTARVESSDDEESLGGQEVFVAEQEVVKDVNENVVEIVNAAQDSTATTTITTEELTLAQPLEALKTLKPKVKGIFIQEQKDPSKSTTIATIPKQQSQDKGKAIMVEEPVKSKKKDQIRLHKEAAKRIELVKGKEKRAEDKLIQESTKKQKVEDDKETT
uniref:Uncharacterized protein n=1 Tax=Tanacetum cinerariifolium TaxID=118510 RepID=A0A6L2JCI2_TANCI|nr:hypothetical protein [Tanacetum cinerariifolium]